MVALTPLAGHTAWESIQPLPVPNGGFACGAMRGKLVVIGGATWQGDHKSWLDGIWVYDPQTQRWEAKGKLPHPLALSVTAETDDGIILAGGFDGTMSRKEIWLLKPSLELARMGDLTEARAAAVGGLVSRLFAAGGGFVNPATLEKTCPGMEIHPLHKRGGSTFKMPGGSDFGLAGVVAVKKELFIFGGAGLDPAGALINLSNVWSFAPETASWRALSPYPFPVRGAAAVRLRNDHILVGGGCGEGDHFLTATFIYDIRKNAFKPGPELPTPGLVGLMKMGQYVYCLGGEDRTKHRADACSRIKAADLLPSPK